MKTMQHRLSFALIVVLLVALFMQPALAQDGFATNTAPPDAAATVEFVLVPRESLDTFMDLTPAREDALAGVDDAPPGDTVPVIVVQPAPQPDPDGITKDDLFKLGLLLLAGFALWVVHRNGIKFSDLVPMPVVQEMVKAAATAGVEAARAYAVSTPTTIDDELVKTLALRVAEFFEPRGGMAGIPPDGSIHG